MIKYQAYLSILVISFFLLSQFAPILNLANAEEAIETPVVQEEITPDQGFTEEIQEPKEPLLSEEVLLEAEETVLEEAIETQIVENTSEIQSYTSENQNSQHTTQNLATPSSNHVNLAPVVTITTPNENAVVTETELIVNVTASDDTGIGSYYIRLWQNAFELAGGGTLVGNCESTPGGNLLGTSRNDTCTFDLTGLPDGTYFVSAQYLDEDIDWGIDLHEITINNTPVAPALPVVEIDEAYANISNGYACGTGSALSDDGLRVLVSNWNSTDHVLQARYFTQGGSYTSWMNLAGIPNVIVNVSGTDAEFIYANTGNTPDGSAGWEVRVIDSTTQEVLSNTDSVTYIVTNDLDSFACGGQITLGFETEENSPQSGTGQCYVTTADQSQNGNQSALQILRWTAVDGATSYVLNGYSWNGSSWVTSYTNYTVPNSELDFISEPGYVIYHAWATNEGRYAYEVTAFDGSSNILSQSPTISDIAICTFTVDRSEPPIDNADISVTKTANVSEASVGDIVQFTITVTNNSLISTATNIIVVDTLSGGIGTTNPATFPSECSVVTPSIICNIAALNPGQSQSFVVEFEITSVIGTQISNSVSVDSDLNETNLDNNTDSVTINIIPTTPRETDLLITKSVDKTEAEAGDSLNYTVTVENISTILAQNVIVEDAGAFEKLNTINVVVSTGTFSYDSVNGVYTWEVGDLAPNTSATMTITGIINNDATGIVDNLASTYSDTDEINTDNNTDYVETEIVTSTGYVDLEVIKTVDSIDGVSAGTQINYVVTVENIGTLVAENVTLRDAMDLTDLDVVSYSISKGSCDLSTNVFNCPIGNITPNEIVVFNLSIMPNVSRPIQNIAYGFTAIESDDINQDNNYSAILIPTAESLTTDIQVTKTANVTSVIGSQNIIYTVTVENISSNTATNVVLEDLPTHFNQTINSVSISKGTCSFDTSSGWYTCNIGDMSPGEVVTLIMNATSSENYSGLLGNAANAYTENTDIDTSNNLDLVLIPIEPTVETTNLSVSKSVDKTTAFSGDTLNYTIEVTNISSNIAYFTNLYDLPDLDNVTVNNVSSSQGTCEYNSFFDLYSCALGHINPGQTVTITMNVTINSEFIGVIENVVTVLSNNSESDLTNNTDNVFTVVIEPTTEEGADIEVVKVADVSTAKTGDVVNYTVTIRNIGDTTAENVQFSDTMDFTRVNVVTYSIDKGTCNYIPTSLSYVCNLGNLAPGETVVFRMSLIPTAAHEMYNAALAISQISTDPNNLNNASTVIIPVTQATQPPVTNPELRVVIFGTAPATNDGIRINVSAGQNFNVISNLVSGKTGVGPYSYSFGGICSGNSNNNTSTSFGSNVLNLAAGSYYCTVTVTDANGKVATAGAPIVVYPTNTTPVPQTPATPVNNGNNNVNNNGNNINNTNNSNNSAENSSIDNEDEFNNNENENGTILGQATCEVTQKVTGFVYNDANINGDKEESEIGLENVKINIYFFNERGERRLLTTDRTNKSGVWEVNLCAGKYEVVVDESTVPSGYRLSENTEKSVEIYVKKLKDLKNINFELVQDAGFNWWIVIIPAIILLVVLLVLAARNRENNA